MTRVSLETVLRNLLEHPRRKWFVIIATCLVAVVAVLPAVDDYKAIAQKKVELTKRLERAQETAARLTALQGRMQHVERRVAELERRSMNDQRILQFRNELVGLVRECGCGLRRIRVGEPRQREWFKDDNPLALRPTGEKLERTPFLLRTRSLSLSVTGSLANLARLLEAICRQDRLVHCTSFVLQRSDEDNELVVMEMELELFELARSTSPPSA